MFEPLLIIHSTNNFHLSHVLRRSDNQPLPHGIVVCAHFTIGKVPSPQRYDSLSLFWSFYPRLGANNSHVHFWDGINITALSFDPSEISVANSKNTDW